MKINIQNYNNVAVMELQGEFISECISNFKDKVTEAIAQGLDGVILDFSSISFIDSESLENLLWLKDYCREQTCQLKIAGLEESCRKIMEMTRIEQEFDIYIEPAEAVKSFV